MKMHKLALTASLALVTALAVPAAAMATTANPASAAGKPGSSTATSVTTVTTPTPAPANSRQATAIPAAEISQDFNIDLVDGCGTWSGRLTINASGYDFYGEVSGTMHAGCNGGSTGHFWYTCAGSSPQNPKTWTTESSTPTDYGMGPCVDGPLVIWTELCYQGPARYACGNSAKLEFD